MIQIGLCGWDSRSLYEAGIRSSDKLEIYSNIYSTVEVNSTFYSFPKQDSLENWYATAPPDFRFSIKLNRLFSHDNRMQLDADTSRQLELFLSSFCLLREKLSWFLLQLPPSLAQDQPSLDGFLTLMRRIMTEHRMTCGIAVEFRHSTWYNEATTGILKAHGAVQVISSSPDLWPCVWVQQEQANYIRLHGRRKMYHTPYSHQELESLKEWIENSTAGESWVYFDNTVTEGARDNSQYLMQLYGLPVPEQTRQLSMLELVDDTEQSLFIRDED